MMIVLLILLITILISGVVMLLSSLLAKKTVIDREKSSPFECGFDPRGSARLPFSLRFFLIAIIFLIFDVEITLLLPLVIIMSQTQIKVWLLVGLFFFLVLLLGLYYEWYQGALNWSE